MIRYSTKLTGDVKVVKELNRSITHAAKQTIIAILVEGQSAVIEEIDRQFVVRGTWYLPSQRHGIHIRWTKNRDDLTGRLETSADWLLEHETGEDKTTDKHEGHLTIPHEARIGGFGGPGKVPGYAKARRILPNVSELATRRLRLSSARPSTNKGKRKPNFKPTTFFMNKEGTAIFERLPGRRIALYYTLSTVSHIKKQSTVIAPMIKTVDLHFSPIYAIKLRETIEFRRGK